MAKVQKQDKVVTKLKKELTKTAKELQVEKKEVREQKKEIYDQEKNLKKTEKELEKKEKELTKKSDQIEQYDKKVLQLERAVAKEEDRLDFKNTYDATLIGALTFVAGLFWRDGIGALFDKWLPRYDLPIAKILLAGFITLLFVMIIVSMRKRTKKFEKKLDARKRTLEDVKVKRSEM